MALQISIIALLLFVIPLTVCEQNILDWGAIPNNSSLEASVKNHDAFLEATVAAQNDTHDKTVLIPKHMSFYTMDISLFNFDNITLQIDGTLLCANRSVFMQMYNETDVPNACLHIYDSKNIVITGEGTFDGQGYDWWAHVWLTFRDHRPHLLKSDHIENLEITGVTFINSPQWTLNLGDTLGMIIRDIRIEVDVLKQRELAIKMNLWDWKLKIPVFPLNTDGIDPRGRNILIENVYIENFDDAVAVKPMSSRSGQLTNCSENIMIRNATVVYGVGMTIGSVPPHSGCNCVRNVTFEDIHFKNALKAIYIKSNPGTSGTGLISGITYRRIAAKNSIWMPLWIGPQQQRQPGTTGTGCSFLYPIIKKCPTNPLVTMENIVLEDVHFEGDLLLPGVLLCDAKNPCTGIQFRNVTHNGLMIVRKSYVCENASGQSQGSSPDMTCLNTHEL